jgi:hypothetical protein
MPTPSELYAEMTSGDRADQFGPLLSAGRYTRAAELFQARDQPGLVPIRELSAYVVGNGILGPIEAAYDLSTDPAVKALCSTALTLVRDDYRLQDADVLDPRFGAMCDMLIIAGLLTVNAEAEVDQKADILAMAQNRRTYAESLWGDGTVITRDDVALAMEVGGGE